jgi:hypothetical protein
VKNFGGDSVFEDELVCFGAQNHNAQIHRFQDAGVNGMIQLFSRIILDCFFPDVILHTTEIILYKRCD